MQNGDLTCSLSRPFRWQAFRIHPVVLSRLKLKHFLCFCRSCGKTNLPIDTPDPMSSLMRYTGCWWGFLWWCWSAFSHAWHQATARHNKQEPSEAKVFFKSAVTRVLHKGFEPFKHCTLLLTKHRLVWPLQCLPLPLQGVFAGLEPQHLLQQHAECEQVRQHQKLMSTKKKFVKHVVFCGAARHSKQF